MNTGKNLHSHAAFESPVSRRQEVSAFGDNGDGDGGDNWIIECEGNDVDGLVYGKTTFYLKHRDTGLYLYTDTNSKYNDNNCRRCPIIGHSEVSCASGRTRSGIWKVHSGFYFPKNKERKVQVFDDEDDEE
jgi:dolichyl-phosphate-mannose--protein O-mannosyl transferase